MEWLLPYTIMLEIYKDYIVNNCSKALLQTANEQLSQMTTELILVTNANKKIHNIVHSPLGDLLPKIYKIRIFQK